MTTFNSKKSFNSKKQQTFKFNSARYAAVGDKIREIFSLYAKPGTPGLDGYSQLNADPNYTRFQNRKEFAEHLVYGCEAQPIKGKTNEDGSQARRCKNPECGGRWRGLRDESGNIDPTQITPTMAALAGITQNKKTGELHMPGGRCQDSTCNDDHWEHGLVGQEPTLNDYAILPLRVPGRKEPMQLQEILANPKMVIGRDENGRAIRVGHYMTDKRTGKRKWGDLFTQASIAHDGASMAVQNFLYDSAREGTADLKDLFGRIGGQLRQAFKTKRKEFDRNDPHGEEYVSIQQGAPDQREALHTLANGTIRNLRETLGDDALASDSPEHRKLWAMAKTPDFTMTSNPLHLLNHTKTPFETIFDVQHGSAAFRSREPGVAASAYAAYPQEISDIGNMADLGNVAKKDPFSSWWRTSWPKAFVNRGVRDIKEDQNPLKVEKERRTHSDFAPETDTSMFEAANVDPEIYKIPGLDEIY